MLEQTQKFQQIEYVLRTFSDMVAEINELKEEAIKLYSNDEYLNEWLDFLAAEFAFEENELKCL